MNAEAVDLLAIGPHPDDIEIGIGGIVAKHAALGLRVGLCDLTAGEMGSNGTVEERLAEAEAARAVLGAQWRVNLRLPDRAIGSAPEHLVKIASLVRQARPRAVALPYWSGPSSRAMSPPTTCSPMRCSTPGCGVFRPTVRPGNLTGSVTTSSTIRCRRHSSWT